MTQHTAAEWPHVDSPFHEGEQAIQARMGVRDKMETIGRRFIRGHMPDQHRQFYEQLPFLILGSVDESSSLDGGQHRRPWASIIVGESPSPESAGVITSPDANTLVIRGRPLAGDPLANHLLEGTDVGLLGIDLATRRRNRVNGVITSADEQGFAIAVTQSFGNCPQYIQKRQIHWLPERLKNAEDTARHSSQFDESMNALIQNADTLFIATQYSTSHTQANHGVDVSHRGGKPGFVKIEGDRTIIFPDFSGNNFFNTLGNIMLDPRVGILFIDFEAGHLLSLTGRADILWDGDELNAFEGAERLIRITADEIVYAPEVLPFRWDFQEYSPSLDFTGNWSAVA